MERGGARAFDGDAASVRGVNQREIGGMLGLDYNTVSVVRKRYRVTADEDRKYLRLAERIESRIKICAPISN